MAFLFGLGFFKGGQLGLGQKNAILRNLGFERLNRQRQRRWHSDVALGFDQHAPEANLQSSDTSMAAPGRYNEALYINKGGSAAGNTGRR